MLYMVLAFAAYSRISDVDTGTFKYFIKVVPTEYQGRAGVSTSCLGHVVVQCACRFVSIWCKCLPQG